MMAFPNYTYPAYGGYNPVTPFAPAPQVYQPQQPPQQPSQAHDGYAPNDAGREESYATPPTDGRAEPAGGSGYETHPGEEPTTAPADRGEYGEGAGNLY